MTAHRWQRLRPRAPPTGSCAGARSTGAATRRPAAWSRSCPPAVIYDLADGDPAARPDAEAGYAACEAAAAGVPERGRVGAGTGAAVGKIPGRERATRTGSATPRRDGRRPYGRGAGGRQRLRRRDRRRRRGARRPRRREGRPARPRRRSRMTEPPDWTRARGAQHDARLRAHRRGARQAGLHAGRPDGERGRRAGGRPGVLRRRRRRRLLHRLRPPASGGPLRRARGGHAGGHGHRGCDP